MSSVRKQYPFDLIEKKWRRRWDEEQTFRAWNPGESIPESHPFAQRHRLSGTLSREALPPKYYILDMFPYPSGAGLHVGHPEGYTATDILARYQRAKGRNVLHPMGWDAFGLPAEQYAIKTGQHPRVTTEHNIANFKRQIQSLGFSYDWSREVNTTDPAYFKWTQWIFLQLYNSWFNPENNKAEPIESLKYPDDCATEEQRRAYRDDHRLAYVKEAPVWWCEALGTVLANEEVIDGKSEIGGHPVVRKPMRQWMLRITTYAERLLRGLDEIDWSESLKEMQRNWIGRSEGAEVDFEVVRSSRRAVPTEKIRVFTTRPDTLFGATYMVLSPEHELVSQITTDEHKQSVLEYQERASRKSDLERTELSKEKTGVFTGAYAINPVNNERIPIWIADYVLAGYGTGAIMAVPAHDARDLEFAKKFDLPIRVVVEASEGEESEGFVGDGVSVNSDFITGLPTPEAKAKITAWLEEKGLGKKTINYKLRDWLFSRQRYWGEPVPIVWKQDAEGNRYHEALPETDLPLVPPPLDDYKPTPDGKPPLARAKDWVELPHGSRRETNTMPQWAGSCWYYLRFLDAKNDSAFCGKEAAAYWMGASLQGWEKQFRELFDFALNNPKNEKRYVTFDRIGTEEAARLDAQIGLKLAGFRRFIDNYAVVHILREHGDPDKEAQRGLAAITFEDFLSIPRIVKFPDKVSLAGRTAIGLAGILYEKKINGWICYVEEVRTKHDLLATKTFFKKPAAASHATEGLAQTSETLRRTQNNISATPGDDKAATPGVDLYVGGTEHAVLHLLYARFWHQVLYDLGYAPTPEPFYKLVNQGLILGEDGQKMSKSRGNVVNPDDILREYGADAFRLYEMFMGPLEMVKPWSTKDVEGVYRFLGRAWRLFIDKESQSEFEQAIATDPDQGAELLGALKLSPAIQGVEPTPEQLKSLHACIKKVTEDLDGLRFNTAISAMMIFTNDAIGWEVKPRSVMQTFLILLQPFAPHIAEELFEKLSADGGEHPSLSYFPWPEYDASLLLESTLEMPIQVNGKVRDRISVSADAAKEEIEKIALSRERIQALLDGREIKKIIVVPKKLINIAVK